MTNQATATEVYSENNLQTKAISATANAVKRGKIPHISTLSCKLCDKQAEHYHHDDYEKPLGVEPLCRKCHKRVHKEKLAETLGDNTLSITYLKRKINYKRIARWLDEATYIIITHGGDPVCELHEDGTGERLDTLKSILSEIVQYEAGAKFELMDDGSISPWPGGYHDVDEFYKE